jgi:CDGSH-type Zn-finger protein
MTNKTPEKAGTAPELVALKEGNTYAWCACGRSSKKTFCDGSHQSTAFTPVIFKAEKNQKAAICLCKHTSNPPYCDGSHNRLS